MRKRIWIAAAAVCFLLGATVYVLTGWYTARYDTSFAGLLFTLTTPMKGVGEGFWQDFLAGVLPPVLKALAGFVLLAVLLFSGRVCRAVRKRFPAAQKAETLRKILGRVLLIFGCLSLPAAAAHAWDRLHVSDYLRFRSEKTMLYEDYYTAPEDTRITAPEDKPNVIWLVLESMETTYASREDGGNQEENYIPNLTRLARENLSFSNSEKLGGFLSTNNTNWTMAALFAGTSGLPFGFPVEQNSMYKYTEFAPAAVSMGDILAREGYRQEFLCGSDGAYGGRALYFTQHGNYEIHDLFAAREKGEIPSDYYVWWGFEDSKLFAIAREELTRLAEGEAPFNLTLLTVDAHHLGGYTCGECGTEYADWTANVIACTDRQVNGFVEWCREQPFWENTVMIITGDHPRMDTCLTEGIPFAERPVYNCILNSRKAPAGGTANRTAVMMDMYPTMLSAMGFTIEGDRLALGTDLLSGKKTLAEEIGYAALNEEVQKYSQFFTEKFARQ